MDVFSFLTYSDANGSAKLQPKVALVLDTSAHEPHAHVTFYARRRHRNPTSANAH